MYIYLFLKHPHSKIQLHPNTLCMDRKFPVSYPDANKFFNGPKLYQITEKCNVKNEGSNAKGHYSVGWC